MENTSPFLFDDVDEKFFLAVRGKAVGPLTTQELYERIQKGEATLLHYVWQDGWQDWKRVYDVREFAVLIPQKPSVASIDHIKERLARKKKAAEPAAEKESDARNYYLYFNSSQFGPFSKKELERIILAQKVDQSAFAWMPGWSEWKPITELKEFAQFLASAAPPVPPAAHPKKAKGSAADATMGVAVATKAGVDASERRSGPRRPLVARLFMHNDQDVIIAICRDISVGGMQVLTDRVPGTVGSRIKLNVSPGDQGKVGGFVAEGEIVRVLEDGRGFSFRFIKLTEEARHAIERYIKSDQ